MMGGDSFVGSVIFRGVNVVVVVDFGFGEFLSVKLSWWFWFGVTR